MPGRTIYVFVSLAAACFCASSLAADHPGPRLPHRCKATRAGVPKGDELEQILVTSQGHARHGGMTAGALL